MARVLGIFRDLLALENTISGWTEAFPTRTEMTAEVAKASLKDIIPRLGIPGSLQRNNGSAFVSQAMMEVSALGIRWTLYSVWRPSPHKLSEIQLDPEMGLSQGMSGNSRKLALVCMWLAPGDKLKLSVFELITHTHSRPISQSQEKGHLNPAEMEQLKYAPRSEKPWKLSQKTVTRCLHPLAWPSTSSSQEPGWT